jgi:Lrp/AsnC family transcriptional regulator for asnA, asnC and gidA
MSSPMPSPRPEAQALALGAARAPISLDAAADLSALDRGIIQALQIDGRRSFAAIAAGLGVTEKRVRGRVAHLRDSGLIEITAVTDPAVLGYHAPALVGVKSDQRLSLSEMADAVWTIAAVDYVAIVAGRYDLLVEVLCPDSAALLRTIETDFREIGAAASLEVLPYLRLHYQEPSWTQAQLKRGAGGRAQRPVLSETDRNIVFELSADGRTPFARIGEQLGISESQVRKRVTRMTSSGAVRIVALTNPRSLGFEALAWLGLRVAAGSTTTALSDRLVNLPSVTYLAVCAGRFDIMAEVLCTDLEDLARLMDEEVRTLPGLASVELMTGLDLRYRRVAPIPRERAAPSGS